MTIYPITNNKVEFIDGNPPQPLSNDHTYGA